MKSNHRLKIRFTEEASDDLEHIYRYTILKWGETQAEKYLSSLKQALGNILNNPQIGIEFTSKARTYRKFIAKEHVVIYRNQGNVLFVARVLHNSQKINLHLRK